jgi:hypothetical protein
VDPDIANCRLSIANWRYQIDQSEVRYDCRYDKEKGTSDLKDLLSGADEESNHSGSLS